MDDRIVYKGQARTIEWAVLPPDGNMPALGQWNELDVKQRAKLLATIKLLGDTGQCRNDERFKHERGKTYAIKARKARAYCFMTKDQRIVITHIAEKKQDKARGSDLDRAERIQVQCVNS